MFIDPVDHYVPLKLALTSRLSMLFVHMAYETGPNLEMPPTRAASERLRPRIGLLLVPPAMLQLILLGHHGKLAALDRAPQWLYAFVSGYVLRQTISIRENVLTARAPVPIGSLVLRLEMFTCDGKLFEFCRAEGAFEDLPAIDSVGEEDVGSFETRGGIFEFGSVCVGKECLMLFRTIVEVLLEFREHLGSITAEGIRAFE